MISRGTATTADRRASAPGGHNWFDSWTPDGLYDLYEDMRRAGRIHVDANGISVITGHADCSSVLRNPCWGRGEGIRGDESRGHRRSFLRQDPPEHGRLRGLVSKAFTSRTVANMAPRIQEMADLLLDAALAEGGTDLIPTFAYPLPLWVICDLMGVPFEDRKAFATWASAIARGEDPDDTLTDAEIQARRHAVRQFRLYFRELIARRRKDSGDDLLSAMIKVRADGDRLSEPDLLATCVLLLFAGHETTVNLIGNGVLALLRDPSQLAMLRQGELDGSDSWVDELLRYDSPVQIISRCALTPLEDLGRNFAAGDHLLLLVGAANRDPAVFDNPARLDLRRTSARHIGFGLGAHFCLGAPLARLEARIAVRTLLQRAPGLEVAGEPVRKKQLVLRGLSSLPVRY